MTNIQELIPKCRICGRFGKQEIRANQVFGGREEHKFWQCGECDAVYLFPVPTEEEVFFTDKNLRNSCLIAADNKAGRNLRHISMLIVLM